MNPINPVQLAAAILRLAVDKALRERLGAAGRKKAVKLFGWQKTVCEFVGVYGGFLPEPPNK